MHFPNVCSPSKSHAAARFVDNRGKPTESYPLNPNGSPGGLAAFPAGDGRITIMMPHPERVFRSSPAELASGAVGRGFAVDADVPQRPGMGGLRTGVDR